MKHLRVVFVTIAMAAAAAAAATGGGTAAGATCRSTPPDALGPFYEAGAPVRAKVGSGYVLSGVVRSARTCKPIPGARVELWLAGPDGEYADRYRATVFARRDGSYRFESHFPPPYSGRPSHIHVRVSARGFRTLVTQHYPRRGTVRARLDLVVRPLG